jgi:AcrR family transcriptional regulator
MDVSNKRRSGGSDKGEQTRTRILDAALSLFRKRGFDETTMRDVAAAAEMSLGAAYYYFSSKDAIVLAYYEKIFADRDKRTRKAFAKTTDLDERVRAAYHLHLDVVRRDRKLLGAIVRSVADPQSDASVFSEATRRVREGSIALFRDAVSVPSVPEELRDLGGVGLWTLDLALMLYLVWDDSPKNERTRQLIDDTLDMLLPLVPMLATPFAAPLRMKLEETLRNAGLWHQPEED